MTSLDLALDVTAAAGLGERAAVAATVTLPDPDVPPDRPVVCFTQPGGYCKGYHTVGLPGPGRGAQAGWHARRGWIFVSVDHPGAGGSTIHARRSCGGPTAASMGLSRSPGRAKLPTGSLATPSGPRSA